MATRQLVAPLPAVVLGPGMTIELEALDPATGFAIDGVQLTNIAFVAERVDTDVAELKAGAFFLVPGPGNT